MGVVALAVGFELLQLEQLKMTMVRTTKVKIIENQTDNQFSRKRKHNYNYEKKTLTGIRIIKSIPSFIQGKLKKTREIHERH